MNNDILIELRASQLQNMTRGMELEKFNVISKAKEYLKYDKTSDRDNQVIFHFLHKLYPEIDFYYLLAI